MQATTLITYTLSPRRKKHSEAQLQEAFEESDISLLQISFSYIKRGLTNSLSFCKSTVEGNRPRGTWRRIWRRRRWIVPRHASQLRHDDSQKRPLSTKGSYRPGTRADGLLSVIDHDSHVFLSTTNFELRTSHTHTHTRRRPPSLLIRHSQESRPRRAARPPRAVHHRNMTDPLAICMSTEAARQPR